MYLYHCQNPYLFFIFLNAYDLAWKCQLILVSQILFYKLWIVFKSNRFALSIITIRVWIIYHCIAYILYFVGFGLYYHNPEGHAIIPYIMPGATMLAVLGQIWLNGVFVNKLFNVHKTDKDLVNIATKSTILCFTCTLATILLCILTPFLFTSITLDFVFWIVVMIDQYTNYWCILLSYKHFDNWYIKLCGACHGCCDSIWFKWHGNNKTMEHTLASINGSTTEKATDTEIEIEMKSQTKSKSKSGSGEDGNSLEKPKRDCNS